MYNNANFIILITLITLIVPFTFRHVSLQVHFRSRVFAGSLPVTGAPSHWTVLGPGFTRITAKDTAIATALSTKTM